MKNFVFFVVSRATDRLQTKLSGSRDENDIAHLSFLQRREWGLDLFPLQIAHQVMSFWHKLFASRLGGAVKLCQNKNSLVMFFCGPR